MYRGSGPETVKLSRGPYVDVEVRGTSVSSVITRSGISRWIFDQFQSVFSL